MAQKAEYKLIVGNGIDVQAKITQAAAIGFKPILMSATVNSSTPTNQIAIIVIAEHIMGE